MICVAIVLALLVVEHSSLVDPIVHCWSMMDLLDSLLPRDARAVHDGEHRA